jgi:hypothetical protein
MARTRQQKPCFRASLRSMVALSLIWAGSSGEAAAASYPRETVEAFIAACQSGKPLDPAHEAMCRCTIAVLQAQVPYQRFAEWERRVAAGEKIPEMEDELRAADAECGR